MNITKEDFNNIPAFKIWFEQKNFRLRIDYFLEQVNSGSEIPATKIIQLLLKEYITYFGISRGKRTVYFDFAWAILENTPELWYDEEKESGFTQLTNHIKDYFPEFKGSDNDDISIMNAGEYLKIGFDILDDDIDVHEVRLSYCYAMYIFFKNGDYLEAEDVINEIENNK